MLPTAIVTYDLILTPKPGATGNKWRETGAKLFFGDSFDAHNKACEFVKSIKNVERILKIENIMIISAAESDCIENADV